MRCEICGFEFSESVYPLHIERCKSTQPPVDDESTQPPVDDESTQPPVDDESTQPPVEQQIEFPRKKRNR